MFRDSTYQEKHIMATIKHDGGWMIIFWGSVEHQLSPVIIYQGSSIRWRLKTSQKAQKDGCFCSGNYSLQLNCNILVAIQLLVYTSPATGVSHTNRFKASTSQIQKLTCTECTFTHEQVDDNKNHNVVLLNLFSFLFFPWPFPIILLLIIFMLLLSVLIVREE